MKQFAYPLCFVLTVLILACQPTTKDKDKENYDCQHCGMPSQSYPLWHAKIILASQNNTYWFCSPRCMFSRYHKHMKPTEAKEIWVKDYYTQKFISAKTAFFVVNSQILGPMGADLVPFSEQKDAQAFVQEHQGKAIFSFQDVTYKVVEQAGK